MSRGRKPKPKEIKKVQGSRDRISEKHKKSNVESMGILPVDIDDLDLYELCEAGKGYFKSLYEKLNGARVLSLTDIETLKILADSYVQFWVAHEHILDHGYVLIGTRKNDIVKNPMVTVKQQAWDRIKALTGEFGLSPASRTRIEKVGEENKDDPIAEILNFKRD